VGVKVTKDKVGDVLASVKRLTSQEVLVGIPGENAGREAAPGTPAQTVTNVQLGYVHEFGSPARNIPARPFLIPGIEGALDRLIPLMRKTGVQALSFGDVGAITAGLIAVGLAGASAVQMKITTGPFEPIKDRTKRDRLTRKASYINASPKRQAEMMAKWMGGDFKPLIDTGALRQSITFVVRPK
jgi:hypothetical protein